MTQERELEEWETIESPNTPAIINKEQESLIESDKYEDGPIQNLRSITDMQMRRLEKMFNYPFTGQGHRYPVEAIKAHKKRLAFLYALAATGKANLSAKMIGYTSTVLLHRWKASDPAFAEAWKAAVEAASDVFEEVFLTDAFEGALEPIYFEGKVVGYVRKRSPKLQEIAIKRFKPEYREKIDVETTHTVKNTGVALIPAVIVDQNAWLESVKKNKQEIIDITPENVVDLPPKTGHNVMKLER